MQGQRAASEGAKRTVGIARLARPAAVVARCLSSTGLRTFLGPMARLCETWRDAQDVNWAGRSPRLGSIVGWWVGKKTSGAGRWGDSDGTLPRPTPAHRRAAGTGALYLSAPGRQRSGIAHANRAAPKPVRSPRCSWRPARGPGAAKPQCVPKRACGSAQTAGLAVPGKGGGATSRWQP